MQAVNSFVKIKNSIESLPIFIVLDSLYSRNDDSPISINKNDLQRYTELSTKLGIIFSGKLQVAAITNARDLPLSSLFSVAEMILFSLTKTKDILLQVMLPEYLGDFFVCHSLNVAFLSCKVAMDKGFSYRELTEVTVAALLHDIGMTRINSGAFEHGGLLDKQEREALERHPDQGAEFLQPLSKDFPWLLRVVEEEHQRENNKGYPASRSGDTHPYSKIVGVCDSFEALTHKRSFRKALHPADAIRIIIDAKNVYYGKEVLRAVIESLSIYPVGSLVQLNNKRIAQVVQAVSGSPLRPIVQVMPDSGNERGEDRLDLSHDNNLYITGLVYDKDYQVLENAPKKD